MAVTLKRHNAFAWVVTTRAMTITGARDRAVSRSTRLYWRIEGIMKGLIDGA